MATAAASRVAVMTHDAFDVDVLRSVGSSGLIGMTSVCMREATRPPKHRVMTTLSAPPDVADAARGNASCVSWAG